MVKIFLGFAFAGDYRTMAGACGRDGSAGLLKRVSQRLLQPLDALPSQTARRPLHVTKKYTFLPVLSHLITKNFHSFLPA